jgi:membrane protease YdiL (CAAX protease family)
MDPHCLRAVRISAFCIFSLIFVPMALMYGSLLTHYDPVDSSGERLQWGFLPFLLWLPYFQVFWRLRDISDSERVKKALAQSVAWDFSALFWLHLAHFPHGRRRTGQRL